MATSSSGEFARLTPHIKAALAHAGDTHSPEDVWNAIERGHAQFWPLRNSVVVTEIVSYPTGRSVRFWLAGGDLEELLMVEPFIVDWAAETHGCNRAEIIGRAGWVKALPEYRDAARVLVKEIYIDE